MKALKSLRLHIGLFGRTNVGKSSLVNSLMGQNISIVSEQEGTTTDVVEKSAELFPVGPVTFLDTAGLDDNTSLGEVRKEKTILAVNRTDVAVIVTDYNGFLQPEFDLINKFKTLNIPYIVVVNKSDIQKISNAKYKEIEMFTKNILEISAHSTSNITDMFVAELLKIIPDDYISQKSLIGYKLNKSDIVLLVTPIDKEAPKGRLILPQVQTIRDLLDNECIPVVCEPDNIKFVLENLKTKPKLVITDSQAFKKVDAIVPQDIDLTSFSILFAQLKGDLNAFISGAKAADSLKDNDEVLILESCTHHAIDDDIARVKIPKMLQEKCKCKLMFDFKTGHDFPDISKYKLIIHCGACMTNRKEVLSRIILAQKSKIPITNYGIIMSYCLGILDRATKIF